MYYQGKDQYILIAESYFPGGTLDLWLTEYETSQPQPGNCECADLPRLEELHFPDRFFEFLEEHIVNETRVAVFKGPLGWITIFVRGDYLLTVESEISLEENLKIVASLIES